MKRVRGGTLHQNNILKETEKHLLKLQALKEDDQIELINQLKLLLHKYSPLQSEPVDCVLWIKAEKIIANDYNPNKVAPPEMQLLKKSIDKDGYTQPIVAWATENHYEVIDGFHRNRVGKEFDSVRERIKGYLPITIIKQNRTEDRQDRIAATIRHNRARGKHAIDGMSDIVVELKRRNWSDDKISRNLGMEKDEILRLCQITGIAELFIDEEFSKSWDIEHYAEEFIPLSDDIPIEEVESFRFANTNDENRIFHQWTKWECYKAGFFNTTKKGMSRDECEQAYADFLSDTEKFKKALNHVITEWKYSCEHYLTNSALNRIAWLGQTSMCYATGIPAVFRSGFYLLTEAQQNKANQTALIYLNKWLKANERDEIKIDEAIDGRQVDLY